VRRDKVAAGGAAARPSGGPVRFVSTALGPGREPWARVLARARAPSFWSRDERGRFSLRQLRRKAFGAAGWAAFFRGEAWGA